MAHVFGALGWDFCIWAAQDQAYPHAIQISLVVIGWPNT